jgi:hypothetical protein
MTPHNRIEVCEEQKRWDVAVERVRRRTVLALVRLVGPGRTRDGLTDSLDAEEERYLRRTIDDVQADRHRMTASR